MKRILLLISILVVLALIFGGWLLLGPATDFEAPKKTLYIRSNAATKKAVIDSLVKNHIISSEASFDFLANRLHYWNTIKPGKYDIPKGTSLLTIVRMLRNGQQTAVNLVINKFRTREDFARATGNKFEFDSLQMINFLNSADSLKEFKTEPEVSMWHIIPDTYTYTWNSTPRQVYRKIYNDARKFWTRERQEKAAALGITPLQAYILASIVEEETTNNDEKDTIASVYLNRYRKGMALGADPTLKFALKDFGLTRIYIKDTYVESPYNTYRNQGFPPGPICTPSKNTIDAVLAAPQTNYLFFVARTDRIAHDFSENYNDHLRKADDYHKELNRRDSIKKRGGK
jgi:UPF0755 protein